MSEVLFRNKTMVAVGKKGIWRGWLFISVFSHVFEFFRVLIIFGRL